MCGRPPSSSSRAGLQALAHEIRCRGIAGGSRAPVRHVEGLGWRGWLRVGEFVGSRGSSEIWIIQAFSGGQYHWLCLP
jgi:hypothetical protein